MELIGYQHRSPSPPLPETATMSSHTAPIQLPASKEARIFTRALPVAVGLLTVVILSSLTDQVLHVLGVYPPWHEPTHDARLYLLALAYRSVFAVLGGYLTARLATRRPMRQVWILGIIGLVLSTAGVVGAIAAHVPGPLWYPIALAATALPFTLLGGAVAKR
jgi:hypothetical protein